MTNPTHAARVCRLRRSPRLALLAAAAVSAATVAPALSSSLPSAHDDRVPAPAPAPTAQAESSIAHAIDAGVHWLVVHQSADGSWSTNDFAASCGVAAPSADEGADGWLLSSQKEDGSWEAAGAEPAGVASPPAGTGCWGPGQRTNDVGVSALALLALLGDGTSAPAGAHAESISRGLEWLIAQQDADSGRVGPADNHAFLYGHGIATLALCRAYAANRSPILRKAAQSAIHFVHSARNPYAAWRYDVPPIGDNDTSITGWMVMALKEAEEAGLQVDNEAFQGALGFIQEVTDPTTARVGYSAVGERSSRIPGLNDHFPPQNGEAMTAVGIRVRLAARQAPEDTPVIDRHAELLLRKLPEWDESGLGCDMYYWYHGTYAMNAMGGRDWRAWKRAIEEAIVPEQRADGHARGSWDPIGPWGVIGGRVYATALMTLCLQETAIDRN